MADADESESTFACAEIGGATICCLGIELRGVLRSPIHFGLRAVVSGRTGQSSAGSAPRRNAASAEASGLLGGHVAVASVLTEESWRRNDTRPSEGGMHECEVRAAELVGQEPVDAERVREHDAIGLAVVETERGSRVGGSGSLVGIFDRVAVASGEDVGCCGTVDVPVLREIPQFRDDLWRHRDVTRGKQILEGVRGRVGRRDPARPPRGRPGGERPLRSVMGGLYVLAGAMHFVLPSVYAQVILPVFPRPLALVYLSGVAEIVLGVGVVVPRTRRVAAWD